MAKRRKSVRRSPRRRRGLHGLGDSPEGHLKKSRLSASKAQDGLDEARILSERGSCSAALKAFEKGTKNFGVFVAHSGESKSVDTVNTQSLLNMSAAAMAAIEDCFSAAGDDGGGGIFKPKSSKGLFTTRN